MLWGHFLIAAAGVVAAGVMIGRVTAELGERLKLGRAWAGAVLLSLATTLPEFVTTVTVAARGEPGMAIGGVLGSVIFNLSILVVIDLLAPEPVYPRLSLNHVGTGLLGCGLLGLIVVGISTGSAGIGGPDGIGVGHVGAASLALLALYLLGQYALFRVARQSYGDGAAVKQRTALDRWPLGGVLAAYAGLAAVIIVSAYHLGVSAEGLAGHYRLGATFAGATLLGIVTSLPEITNAVACARQKEYDLAVGNILGANALVFMALVAADFFYAEGRLLNVISHTDALSSLTLAGAGIVMQAVALGALAVHSADRVWRFSIASLLLVGLYAASLMVSYRFSALVR